MIFLPRRVYFQSERFRQFVSVCLWILEKCQDRACGPESPPKCLHETLVAREACETGALRDFDTKLHQKLGGRKGSLTKMRVFIAQTGDLPVVHSEMMTAGVPTRRIWRSRKASRSLSPVRPWLTNAGDRCATSASQGPLGSSLAPRFAGATGISSATLLDGASEGEIAFDHGHSRSTEPYVCFDS